MTPRSGAWGDQPIGIGSPRPLHRLNSASQPASRPQPRALPRRPCMPIARHTTSHLFRAARRGSSLYVLVLSTALLVSLLGVAGLSVVRVERRQASTASDRLAARANARSAVEWGLAQLNANSSWRTAYTNGSETATKTLGTNGVGTVSWIIQDSDGSLAYPDTALRLKGLGRNGNTVQVSSVGLFVANADVGPQVLFSQTNSTSSNDDQIASNNWYGQYFKPSFPADATGWRVTSVELYSKRENNNKTFGISLYTPLATNMPSTTVVDSLSLNSKDVDPGWKWQTFTFSGSYSLTPGTGLCLGLTTTASSQPLRVAYQNGGITAADSAMITGNPTWQTYETNKALVYRINGVYTTASGTVSAVAGTWQWDAPP